MPKSSNTLWTFKYDTKTQKDVKGNIVSRNLDSYTPLLVPANTSRGQTSNQSLIETINTSVATVDVAKRFPWTYSPAGNPARTETPTIELNEKRLKTNAFISSIIYSFGNTREGIQEIAGFLEKQGFSNFTNVLKQLKDSLVTGVYTGANAVSNIPQTAAQLINPTSENVPQLNTAGTDAINDVASFFKEKVFDSNPSLDSPFLQSYKNLYPSVNTGWKYIFPYFDDYYGSSQNIFGEDSSGGLNVLRMGSETIQNIAGIAGTLSRPFGFSFQEKAKFYNFPSEGEEFSFTFPLINTGSITFDEVVRNWQLIFLLLYQNKPARINRNIIEPPVFYEVRIPGQKYYPFCYITGITVDFKGSRRQLSFNIDVQQSIENETTRTLASQQGGAGNKTEILRDLTSDIGTKNFSAIIPDAYVIKINMKSLVTETRNFMAYTVLGGYYDKVVGKITDLDADAALKKAASIGNSAINSNGSFNNSAGGGSGGGLQSGSNTPVNFDSPSPRFFA